MNHPTRIPTWRLVLAAIRTTIGHHRDPHYDCQYETEDRPCDGLNDRGAGHVCDCDCRRCSLTIDGLEVCVCRGCDARACGLHVTTRNAIMEENAR